VLDNLNIHHGKSLTDLYGRQRAVGMLHYSLHPHPSLHSHPLQLAQQAKIEIGLFAHQYLGRRRIPYLTALCHKACARIRQMNCAQTHINWRFDRRTTRRKFGYAKQFYKRSKIQTPGTGAPV
jgi:hypothetical protein